MLLGSEQLTRTLSFPASKQGQSSSISVSASLARIHNYPPRQTCKEQYSVRVAYSGAVTRSVSTYQAHRATNKPIRI